MKLSILLLLSCSLYARTTTMPTDLQKRAELFRDDALNASMSVDGRVAPELLIALAITESTLDPWALRVERGFWQRYGDGIKRFVLDSPSKVDNRWMRYPDIYSASYGICQIMIQTALEAGWKMRRFPTELCDPETNFELAAKLLNKHLRNNDGDIEKALLRYNGGGDPNYPDRVFKWLKLVEEWKLFA